MMSSQEERLQEALAAVKLAHDFLGRYELVIDHPYERSTVDKKRRETIKDLELEGVYSALGKVILRSRGEL